MSDSLTAAVDATILNAARRAAKRKDVATLKELLARATFGKTKTAIIKMIKAAS